MKYLKAIAHIANDKHECENFKFMSNKIMFEIFSKRYIFMCSKMKNFRKTNFYNYYEHDALKGALSKFIQKLLSFKN